VNSAGVASAKGPGTALVTASVTGATSVTAVTVSLGDPLTTVVGLVQLEDGTLVSGADVHLIGLSGTATTQSNPPGAFTIAGAESAVPLRAIATAFVGGQRIDGGSAAVSPMPAGFTDVGLVTLNNEVFWVSIVSGSWHTGVNWSIGDPPSSNHKVTVDVPADITVTYSQGTSSIADLLCREDFLLLGGTLTLNGPLPSFFNGPFTLQGGSLDGAGNLIIGSTMTWKGGTIGGTGTLTAPPGSTVSLAAGSLGLSRTFVNQGTINVTDGDPTMNLSGGGTLTNTGTVAVASGRTVTVNSGVLNLQGGTFGGAGSTIALNSATVNLDPDFAAQWSGRTHQRRRDVHLPRRLQPAGVEPGVARHRGLGGVQRSVFQRGQRNHPRAGRMLRAGRVERAQRVYQSRCDRVDQ
ncbi:MAG: hypothetical protein HYR83_06460, partial [Planctomycetes bacterium]|nr:hypothetical protein [Planctomycetota bacterium]